MLQNIKSHGFPLTPISATQRSDLNWGGNHRETENIRFVLFT